MNLTQLQAFQEKSHEAFSDVFPIEVKVDGVTYEATGTTAGHKLLRLENGGQARNRDAQFSLVKTARAEIPIGKIVEINGHRFVVRKVWGHDSCDVAYSYRADQWAESA
jgi:hypothetical protein